MIRILAIEDESHLQKLLEVHFKREKWDVVFADSAEAGLLEFEKGNVDVVVLDWMLKGNMTGLDLCKKLAGQVPILMLTARSTAIDIIVGLESGADDYLTKPFEADILVARMRALLRRSVLKRESQPSLYKLGDLEVFPARYEVKIAGQSVELTTSEFKLLVAMLEGRGTVLSRKKLLQKIQDSGVNVVERIVDTHVYSLRKKIGACGDFIETIRGIGYRIKP